jgi:hypothetical protein
MRIRLPEGHLAVAGRPVAEPLLAALENAADQLLVPPAAANGGGADSDELPTHPTVAAALEIIRKQRGKGIQGKALVTELAKKHIKITQTYLRRHVIPGLKRHGVKNLRSRGGYYLDPV